MLRKIVLKILKATAKDITITHHYTHKKFMLNSYNHKGYWYHGKKREEETVAMFKKWISKDNYVLEIGGHIGYFSTFYADLVGDKGKVVVFEPSNENLKYLTKNIDFLDENLKSIISIVQKGAGDIVGELDFYIDPISGQNNSFVKDFDGFKTSRAHSADTNVDVEVQKVPVITLDSFYENETKFPDFVKIDVEGFEWNVIQGFKQTIEKAKPNLMIEIQSDEDKIINYFKGIGYIIYNDKLESINSIEDYKRKRSANIFFKWGQK
ncbi:FkbM family methyltransferase [Flavobacterium dankookense]|uniref:FkbM family methyltransferase n=1 Tax=Flavobacterium dankookense TaxID=706186 RepID=A0A4R6QA31_9FLAO|nr:FkbM family methyltransferase [Flavobacterium dankookense]TDP59201.1 FkbM family methyltransferase [Flavobacterium dankookense]